MVQTYTSKIKTLKKLIAGDVWRVENYAHFLLIVDEDGRPLAMYSRSNAPLNVIAVLGPVVYWGYSFGAALLLEIGLGRARPYHDARAPIGVLSNGRCIAKRRNYGLMSVDAFKILWPYICDILAEYAEEIVGMWKHRSWNVETFRTRVVYKDYQNHVSTKIKETEHSRGVRISIAFQDKQVIRIMCGLDIERLRGGIHSAAQFLSYCLNGYINTDYTDAQLRLYVSARASKMRLLVESFGPKEGREYGRLQPHHVAYMYAAKMISLKNRALFERCASFFHLVDLERVSFFEQLYFEEQKAISGFDVWIIPERRTSADYLVCEIIPRGTILDEEDLL